MGDPVEVAALRCLHELRLDPGIEHRGQPQNRFESHQRGNAAGDNERGEDEPAAHASESPHSLVQQAERDDAIEECLGDQLATRVGEKTVVDLQVPLAVGNCGVDVRELEVRLREHSPQ